MYISTHRWSNEKIETQFARDGGIAPVDVFLNTETVIRRWHANRKWLLCDVCDKSCSNTRPFRRSQMRSEQYAFIWLQLPCDSGLGSAICVQIRRSCACQEQIQHGISARSWTCRHSEACRQRCLSNRCIPGGIKYDQPNAWPYMRSKYLLSCVNWMDENANYVHRAHNQLNRKCPSIANTRCIALRN